MSYNIIREFPTSEAVISEKGVLGSVNGINVFINEKYKNILIVINNNIDYIFTNVNELNPDVLMNNYLTFNNTSNFDQREGLYHNQTISGVTSFDNYDPNLISASNYIASLNDMNNKNGFDEYVTFHYIGKDNTNDWLDYGNSKINVGNVNDVNYPMRNVSSWSNDFTPIKLDCELPNSIETKKNSYIVASIKGPKFNIYDKFKTDFNETIYDNSFIKEPLSRYIIMNEKELLPKERFTKELNYSNNIYRYNGFYEPIFKDIELFYPIEYTVINGGFFTQTKCGGYFNEINEISNSNKSLIISENKNELNILNNNLIYITEQISIVTNNLNNANKINDQLVIDKLNTELTFYQDLYDVMLNSISSIESKLSSLITQVTTISSSSNISSWIFKDKSLGLCDGNYTLCELEYSEDLISNILYIYDFVFNIPLDSVINGIEVDIRRRSSVDYGAYAGIVDDVISLVDPTGVVGNNYANNIQDVDNWSTTTTSVTYGNEVDMWNLTGLTALDINSPNFGVYVSVKGFKINDSTTIVNIAYIDCVCITVHYTINGIQTGNTYTSSLERNTKFDTNLSYFGEISELIYSKVTEYENPLKIKGTEEDRSIYPMIDEFGYQWDRRFIFKSSWDDDYFFRTKNEIE